MLCGSSVAHQANELQLNAKVTIDSTKHVGREGLDEPEDYVFDVFEEDDIDGSNIQPKQLKDSAVSGRNSTPKTESKNPQGATQSLEPAPAVAQLQ